MRLERDSRRDQNTLVQLEECRRVSPQDTIFAAAARDVTGFF